MTTRPCDEASPAARVGQVYAAICAAGFSLSSYPVLVWLYNGVGWNALVDVSKTSFLFYLLGFVLGTLALVFSLLFPIHAVTELLFPGDCCPASDGGVGLLAMGPLFVGSALSTYLLAARWRRLRLTTSRVVILSVVPSMIWLASVYLSDVSCQSRPCLLTALPPAAQS